MKYQIIKNSESKTGYDIPDDNYYGYVQGFSCGWQFEFRNNKGEINYNSVSYYEGTPEDYCNSWLRYGEDALFTMERFNGWEPTGRVVFRGYGDNYYDPWYREWFVNPVSEKQILRVLQSR